MYLDQATSLFDLACAPRTCFAVAQTTNNLPCARNIRRSDPRQSRTAGGKRAVAATTHHLAREPIKRPVYKKTDRLLLVFLARMVRTWKQALFLVQPDTLLRWHRELFRLLWKHKSRAQAKKPRLSLETITLIDESFFTLFSPL